MTFCILIKREILQSNNIKKIADAYAYVTRVNEWATPIGLFVDQTPPFMTMFE